jgi:Predicted membrane protein
MINLSLSLASIDTKSLKAMEINSCHRLQFIDRTRGLIMVFMALDHALFFWSSGRINNEGLPLLINGTVTFNPIGTASPLALIVMFLSSICAPGFFFIAGYILALSIRRRELNGSTGSNIRNHLWLRGMLLIVFQVFIASPAFNLALLLQTKSLSSITLGTLLSLSVLSTIGICFFILAFGRHISPWKLLGVCGIVYLLSQFFLPSITRGFPLNQPWLQACQAILVLPVPFSSGLLVNNNFPVIPWLFPIVLGWLYGYTYSEQCGIAYEAKRFCISGFCSLALFFIFRFAGIGDYLLPNDTVQFFFGLSKYPPSLDYFLFYLGLVFLLLFLFYQLPKKLRIGKILEDFGRAPLFFYNTHLWLYATVPALLSNFNGYSLMFGIGIWLLGLFILYPLCHWFLVWRLSTKILVLQNKMFIS